MATRKILLKEDTTGLHLDNFFEDEEHDIGTGTYRAFTPEYGAFFAEGFVLKDNNDVVIDKQYYSFGDLYQEATRDSGKAVWNSILLHNVNIPKDIKITYHAYGGKFARNARLLLEWVQEKMDEAVDPIDWTDVTDKPKEYVPAFHYHIWKEVHGWKFIREPLTSIENAIILDKSPYFDAIIRDIQQKLEQANVRAMELAAFYANKAISDATLDITRETLGIHLLANLRTAPPSEMAVIAKSSFNGASLTEDKYINKKGLMAFTDVLKDRSVNMQKTGLGLLTTNVRESKRGALLSLGNGSLATLKSKKELVDEGNFYEENVYPKNFPETDRFTVVRITNNITNHGGAFLGFNNTTTEMYSGVLTDDRCFMRIRWYKFYSELTYDKILDVLMEHINAKNNPHKLTKKQVNLEKVANYPVATIEEILGDDPKDSYMTLDGIQLFMTKHMLDLKPEFNEDGTLNKDSDLFNKPNLIFTPCDKKVPNNCPPKGQLLKTYCDGTDRFQRLADGNCGFTDEVLQLDSDDCKFFEIKPQGEVLHTYCEGTTQMAVIADGRGGTSTIVYALESEQCGWDEPPPAGTVLSEGCEGLNYVRNFADGNGGIVKTTIVVNSEDCGYIPPTTQPPATTRPPAGKSIVLSSTHTKLEVGVIETFTGKFYGYNANETVQFVLEGREPLGTVQGGAYKDWYDALSGTVTVDGAGNGTWTFTQADDGLVPRGTTWQSRIVDSGGTTSNTIIREFVSAGGGVTTQPPTGTTTQPPNTSKTIPYYIESGPPNGGVVGNVEVSYNAGQGTATIPYNGHFAGYNVYSELFSSLGYALGGRRLVQGASGYVWIIGNITQGQFNELAYAVITSGTPAEGP